MPVKITFYPCVIILSRFVISLIYRFHPHAVHNMWQVLFNMWVLHHTELDVCKLFHIPDRKQLHKQAWWTTKGGEVTYGTDGRPGFNPGTDKAFYIGQNSRPLKLLANKQKIQGGFTERISDLSINWTAYVHLLPRPGIDGALPSCLLHVRLTWKSRHRETILF